MYSTSSSINCLFNKNSDTKANFMKLPQETLQHTICQKVCTASHKIQHSGLEYTFTKYCTAPAHVERGVGGINDAFKGSAVRDKRQRKHAVVVGDQNDVDFSQVNYAHLNTQSTYGIVLVTMHTNTCTGTIFDKINSERNLDCHLRAGC